MEKLHDNQTAEALQKAGAELDCLVRLTSRDELQDALWQMFRESLCRGDDDRMISSSGLSCTTLKEYF